MRKKSVFFLCTLLLVCVVSAAAARTVYCPGARLTLTVPDDWQEVPLSGFEDPDLCLLLEGGDLSLSVYASEAGSLLPDAFQVFTGDETESFSVTLSGVEMTCVAGKAPEGDYRVYTWLDRSRQVQFWFLVTGPELPARSVIEGIMSTLVFN